MPRVMKNSTDSEKVLIIFQTEEAVHEALGTGCVSIAATLVRLNAYPVLNAV